MTNPQTLINRLSAIPSHWALTPLLDKSPLRPDWQHEQPISRNELKQLLTNGQKLWSQKKQKNWHCKWTGYGLRTGEVSGGLVAIDIDGHSAEPILQEISGGEIPLTVSWTSGKPGKRQILFQLPSDIAEQVKRFTRSVLTEWAEFRTKSSELLEIRYNSCQSALPPSKHPDTGCYYWLNSPASTTVATAPQWLCELVVNLAHQEAVKLAAQKKVKTERAADISDPWDIRNLAQYLQGYNPHGRRKGWITAKCPAHNGQSDDSLHIEESSGAFKCHAGCDPKEVYQAVVNHAIANGAELSQSSRKKGTTLGELLYKCRKKIRQQMTKWGFFSKANTPASESERLRRERSVERSVIEYPTGERLKTWGEFAASYKYILDISGTGCGKSYDAGQLNTQSLGKSHALYITNDPRNPSNQTLVDWLLLNGRNNGLKQDDLGKWRRVKPGAAYQEPPNCSRTQTIDAIRGYGIKNADRSELICKGCNNYELCKMGVKYGYINARAKVLSIQEGEQKKIRSHPSSLPSPTPVITSDGSEIVFPYEQTVLVWEEASDTMYNQQSIDVNVRDLEKLTLALLDYPELLKSLQPLLSKLKDLLDGSVKQPNKFGWSHNKLMKKLTKCDVDLVALLEATRPDLSELNTVGEYGEDISNLPRHLRKRFNDSDSETAEHLRQSLLKQWILPFVTILNGTANGYISLRGKTLTITHIDNYLPSIAGQAGVNIFLDATGDVEQLAAILGVEPNAIAVVKEEAAPVENLEIIQVAGLGRLGINRGADQQRRVEAILWELNQRYPDAAIFRFKKYAQACYRHFAESRGVNDAQTKLVEIIDGIPCENVEALRAKFTCIHGYVPSDETVEVEIPVNVKRVMNSEGNLVDVPSDMQPTFTMSVPVDEKFRRFVDRHIQNTIKQEIGRLRANRRPDSKLTVYVLGDYPLDLPVTLVSARDITPDAAPKEELVLQSVRDALVKLQEQGRKATQSAIAQVVGVTQQHVSRLLKKLTHFALSNTLSKMCITDELCNSPEDSAVCQQLADDYLPVIAELPTAELFAEVELLAGLDNWVEVWQRTGTQVQQTILTKLFMLLPLQQLERFVNFATG
ncbi:MAG: bifunctional DNA primase/polymerase [Phormidium sp.]